MVVGAGVVLVLVVVVESGVVLVVVVVVGGGVVGGSSPPQATPHSPIVSNGPAQGKPSSSGPLAVPVTHTVSTQSKPSRSTHQYLTGVGVVVVVLVVVLVVVVVVGPPVVVVVGSLVVVVGRHSVMAVSQFACEAYDGGWQLQPSVHEFEIGDQSPPMLPCHLQPEPQGLAVVVVVVVVE